MEPSNDPVRDPGVDAPTLDTRTRTQVADAPEAMPLEAGDPLHLDRYEIVGRLGAGGMGVVYEAFDPQLRRSVALKVLRPRPGSEMLTARLVLEGQALARLSHPNVVEVYGVGTDGGRLWLAMELVRGGTLRDWLRSPRFQTAGFGERLDVVVQAGWGLAAAHQAGIIHRDFKPANVLMGEDGRVRVADFGIAQHDRTSRGEGSEILETAAGESELTKTGRVVGTPKYMAPEQRAGEVADERSDQYAFGLTAWEVLHGRFPFATETLEALGRSQREDAPAVGEESLPRHVQSALRRAVALSPRRRHRSVMRFATQLVGSSRRVATVFSAVAVAIAGALVASRMEPAAVPSGSCHQRLASDALGSLWSPQRRMLIAEALSKTGPAYAEPMSRAVGREVASFSAAWTDAYTASCRTQAARGLSGRTQHAATVVCLSRRAGVVQKALLRLESGRGGRAERAASTVREVASVGECQDEREAVATVSTPVDFQDRLAAAEVAAEAGDTQVALDTARELAEVAAGAGDRLAEGDALAVMGVAYAQRRDSDEQAAAATLRAYEISVAAGFDLRSAKHAGALARRYAMGAMPQDARSWQRHEIAAVARAGMDAAKNPSTLVTECYLAENAGPSAVAVDACERAVRAVEATGRGSRTGSWSVRARLGLAYFAAGRAADARAVEEALLSDAEAGYGRNHPRVGGMHMNLGRAASNQGKYVQALEHYHASLRVFRRAYHPSHRWVLAALMNTAHVHSARGEYSAAEGLLDEAIRLAEHRENIQFARLLNNLASVKSEQGQLDEALSLLLSVQRLESSLLGKDDVQAAVTHLNLADVYAANDRLEEAILEATASIKLREAASKVFDLASSYRLLASYQRRLGRLEEAEANARRALAAIRSTDGAREEEALDLLELASVLRTRGEQGAADETVFEAELTLKNSGVSAPRTEAKVLLAQAKIKARRRRPQEARALVETALSVAEGHEDVEAELRDWLATLPPAP